MVFHFAVKDKERPAPEVSIWSSDIDIDVFSSECMQLFHGHRLDGDVLAVYIYSSLLKTASMGQTPSRKENYPDALSRALKYIEKRFDSKIAVEDLATYGGVSVSHLFKLFQRHLGTTPHQYILAVQLAHARTSLISTSKTIQEISLESGFENLEVFYRRFRKESGMPPGEYRKKHMPYHFAR